MKGFIEYKRVRYFYYFDKNFYNFMDTEIFHVLIKDIRDAKKKEKLCIEIKRDIEPCYALGEFAGMRNNGTTLTINDNVVEGIPAYAIDGLMNYVSKYAGI